MSHYGRYLVPLLDPAAVEAAAAAEEAAPPAKRAS
jgi:hypothetical protein